MSVDEQRIESYREAAQALQDGKVLQSAFVAGVKHDETDPGKHHRDDLKRKAHDYAMKGGYDDTSKAGLRLNQVSASGTSGAGGKSDKQRAAERAYEEALLHALQTNALGAYIAEEVFGDMSEAEIDDIVAEIEATSGQSFEAYARGILGDEEVQRLPGESDADFRRRILGKITEEIIDPETGEIKPQYANDPLAQIIQGNEAYQTIVRDLQALNAQVAEHGKTAETDRLVERTAGQGYAQADVTVLTVEDSDYKTRSKDIQDAQRDGVMDSAEKTERNTGFFAALGEPSAAEVAARKAHEEFNSVAPPQPADGPRMEREVAAPIPPSKPVV